MVLVALKTAGLVLLIGVIIVVALCALILFMPIRYQASGNIEEKEFHFNINYLFRIVRLRAGIGDEIRVVLWILFFPIVLYPKDEEKDAEKKKKRAERKKRKKARKIKRAKKKRARKMKKLARQAKGSPNKRAEYEKELNKEAKDKEEGTEDENKVLKVVRIITKILKLMLFENGIEVLQLLLEQVKYVAYHARPRRAKADICMGFQNPSTTGMILGGISMASFLFEYDIHIEPEFDTEETILTGTFDVAGRISLIYVIIAIIRIVKVKEFRVFIKKAIKEFRKK